MKKLTVKFENIVREATTVKSEAAMWNLLREVRDSLTDADLANTPKALVTDEEGNLFKDITFKRNAKGKIEMPNAVKATCRRAVEKARKAAKEAAEKAAAKKARKAEANRRYRERKKAEKAAAACHHDLLVEGSIAAAEDPDTGINC